jgi:hypothetical protein
MKKIKSRFTLFLILSSLLIPVLSFTPIREVKGAELTFFEDDFESYAMGMFPYSGGWELWYNGAGTEQQVIVDNFSVSATKSLKLLGLDMWAAFAAKRFTSSSNVIGFEVAVRVEETKGQSRDDARVSFTKKLSSSISREYALVTFQDDGTITSGGQVLQSYVDDTWYKIKLIMKRDSETYSVWVDGELKGENLAVKTTSGDVTTYPSYEIEAFSVSQCYNGVTAYFDDVKIFSAFEANPKLELVPAKGIAATTLVGSGFAPNSKISVTWDDTPIPTVPSPLITDGNGNFTAIISVLNQTTSGIYTVKAVDEIGTEATATFTVTLEAPEHTQNIVPENTSLVISVLSPENTTYDTTDIPLEYTVNRFFYWTTYSLDGQPVVDPENTTTLSGIADGPHELTFHANYSDSHMGESATVWFSVDTTPPNITDVVQAPVDINGNLGERVSVNATVIDTVSGVERVSLNYTDGNGTWVIVKMTNVEGDVWNGTIPAFPHGTNVTYIIIAEDEAGNTVTTEELYGHPNQYEILPEFPLWIILPMFLVATASTIAVRKRISIPAFAKICNSIHKLLS